MEMEKTRVSKVLRSLEDRGYIDRTTDQADHRIDHLSLTGTGICLADSILFELRKAGEALLKDMPEQEREAFTHFLELAGDKRTTDLL